MQKRLSIGILVESYNVPNWVYTMLEKILIDDCAQIVAVVVNSSYNALEQDKTTYNLFERIFYSAMWAFCITSILKQKTLRQVLKSAIQLSAIKPGGTAAKKGQTTPVIA